MRFPVLPNGNNYDLAITTGVDPRHPRPKNTGKMPVTPKWVISDMGNTIGSPYKPKPVETTPTTGSYGTTSGGGDGGASAAYNSLLVQMQTAQADAKKRAEELAAQRQAAAQAAYDKNMGYLNQAYIDRGNALKGNYDNTLGQLQADHDAGARGINQNADRALQEAYINYMMSKRDLPQALTAQGITGGATETVTGDMYNNYGNNRNRLELARGNDLADLGDVLARNKANALNAYNNQKADDSARKLAYQMQLEQALANGTDSILQDKFKVLQNLDNAYTQKMIAIQQAQAKAAASAANRQYKADNGNKMVTTDITKTPAYKKAVSLFNMQGATPEAIYEEMRNTGVDTDQIDEILAALGL